MSILFELFNKNYQYKMQNNIRIILHYEFCILHYFYAALGTGITDVRILNCIL